MDNKKKTAINNSPNVIAKIKLINNVIYMTKLISLFNFAISIGQKKYSLNYLVYFKFKKTKTILPIANYIFHY